MLFTFAITIPANTSEPSVPSKVLPLTAGTITRILIDFPAGQIGLTHLRLRRGLNQVWPSNPEANFSSSNATIDWNDDYDITTAPFQLEAYAWNLDDTFEHTITVHLALEPLAVEQSLIDQVRNLVGLGTG